MPDTCDQDAIVDFLCSLSGADADKGKPVRVDTHANIIVLSGSRAYKIKRAVRFPFLDYSTLEKREASCKAEIARNQVNAPDIYLNALPVTEKDGGTLSLGGDGKTVEWVVVMNRFDPSLQMDAIAEKGPLSRDICEGLAAMLAASHACAEQRPHAGAGFAAELASYLDQNDQAFAEHPDLFPPQAVSQLSRQSRSWLSRIEPLILRRGSRGHIRLCHGDAHLRNIVMSSGKPVLFDAIEFSDAIATTDTLYDLAFLLMDLWERDQRPAANLVFNRYLDRLPAPSDDVDCEENSFALLPFYLMMRASIRAKIAASAALTQKDGQKRAEQEDQARVYFRKAQEFLEPAENTLIAIGGLSGTGKTTLAYAMAPDLGRAPGARVLRTDVERKKRFNIAENEPAPQEAYTKEASQAVYAVLEQKIHMTLAGGHSAIFDAVFADETERRTISAIAQQVEARFAGLWLEAPTPILKQRVTARQADASDASDAGEKVVDRQLDYDLGSISWHHVDAGGPPERTLKAAREALGQKSSTTT